MYKELLKALLTEMIEEEATDFAQYLSEQSQKNHQQALAGKRLAELEQMNQKKDEVIMQLKGYIYDLMNQNKMYRTELSRVGNGLQKELDIKKETIKALKQENEALLAEKSELIKQNRYLKEEAQKARFFEEVIRKQNQEIESLKNEDEPFMKEETVEVVDFDQLRSFIQTLGQDILSEVAMRHAERENSVVNKAANKMKDSKDALAEAIKRQTDRENELVKNMVSKAKEAENILSKAAKKQADNGNMSVNDPAAKAKDRIDTTVINITNQCVLIGSLDQRVPSLKIKERIKNGEQIYILEEGNGDQIGNCSMFVTQLDPAVKTSIMCATGAKNVLAIFSK